MNKIFTAVSVFVVAGAIMSSSAAAFPGTSYCDAAMSKDRMPDRFLCCVRVNSRPQ